MSGSDLQHRLDGAMCELDQLRAENERLRTLLALAQQTKTILDPGQRTPARRASSSPASADEKVALVRRLFDGRDDVYARRWENARTGKSGYAPATAEGWSRQEPKTYLPLSNETIQRHLRGRESIGIYPLLETLLDTLLNGFVLPHSTTTILQDWTKGRHSEVDDINGYVARTLTQLGRSSPVNTAIVDVAHEIERGSLHPSASMLAVLMERIGPRVVSPDDVQAQTYHQPVIDTVRGGNGRSTW